MKQTYTAPQVPPERCPREERYKQFLLGFGFWASIAILIFLALKYLLRYLMPFVVALAVAALLQPLVRKMAGKMKIKKSVLSVILVILVYVILASLLVLCTFGVVSTLVDWVSALPAYYTNSVAPAMAALGQEGSAFYARLDPELAAFLESIIPSVTASLSSAVTNFSVKVVSWASSVATSLPNLLLSTIICVIATVFLSADYDAISGAFRGAMPARAAHIFRMVKSAFKTIIKSYIRSYLLVMLITFGEILIGLLIMRVPDAPLIAVIVAVFDILPIVGSGMVLVPWAVVLLIQGQIGRGVGICILFVIVMIARQIMEPKLVGKRVGLHPLATLICIWVGVKTLGIAGMFGFPITLLIIKDLRAGGVIGKNRNKTCTCGAAAADPGAGAGVPSDAPAEASVQADAPETDAQ